MKPIEWSKAYESWGFSMASIERSYSPARLLDVLRRFLPSRGPVLELGSAPGRWLAWIERNLNIPTVGIDLDAEGTRLSRRLFPGIRVLRGNAMALPFPDESFAASFSLGLVEHFEDPSPILSETFRVMRPGGIVICSVPNLGAGTLLNWHWRTTAPENFSTHRPFTLDELAGLVQGAGFSVVHREYNGLYVPHAQRILGRVPGRRWLARLGIGPVCHEPGNRRSTGGWVIALSENRRGAVWLGLAVMVAATAAIQPEVSLLPAAVLTILMAWRWTDTALTYSAIIVLAIRPATDIFSNSRDPTASTALRPSPVIGLLVLLIAAVVAARRLRSRQLIWPVPQLRHIHYWLFAAYGIAVLSGAAGYGSEGLFVGIRELVRMGSTIAALLLILWWVEGKPERYHAGWMLLFLGTVPPLAVAMWQWATGQGYAETEGLNRLYGTFSHPHSLGPYLVPFILFAAGGLIAASWTGRVFRLLVIGFFTLVLVLTYSRTALLVLLAGFAVLPFLHARRLGARAFMRTLAGIAVVMAIGWGIFGGAIKERFATITVDREVLEAALAGQSENSFTWRILNWGILTRMGLERPLAGHGAGMTTVLNPLVNVDYGGKPFNAHNDFVRWFFEGGVLGLVCFVVYGVLLCRWALRQSLRASKEAAPGAFAIVAALMAMIFLSLGTTEFSSQTAVLYEFHGILALLSIVPTRPGDPVPAPA